MRWITGTAGALALAVFACGISVAQTLDPQTLLPGWWGWVPMADDPEDVAGACENQPMRIWFSEDGERYNSVWVDEDGSEHVSTSRILRRLPSTETTAGFLIQYDGEERLDDQGNPVAWYLFMTGPTRFVWVREDWVPNGGTTRPLERCDGSIVS